MGRPLRREHGQVAAPTEREWGGYSAYVADPEIRWEIAWAPGLKL
jgi:uncharacterized protein